MICHLDLCTQLFFLYIYSLCNRDPIVYENSGYRFVIQGVRKRLYFFFFLNGLMMGFEEDAFYNKHKIKISNFFLSYLTKILWHDIYMCALCFFFFLMALTKQQKMFSVVEYVKTSIITVQQNFCGILELIHLIRTPFSVGICSSWRQVACAKAKVPVARHILRTLWMELGKPSSTAPWSS